MSAGQPIDITLSPRSPDSDIFILDDLPPLPAHSLSPELDSRGRGLITPASTGPASARSSQTRYRSESAPGSAQGATSPSTPRRVNGPRWATQSSQERQHEDGCAPGSGVNGAVSVASVNGNATASASTPVANGHREPRVAPTATLITPPITSPLGVGLQVQRAKDEVPASSQSQIDPNTQDTQPAAARVKTESQSRDGVGEEPGTALVEDVEDKSTFAPAATAANDIGRPATQPDPTPTTKVSPPELGPAPTPTTSRAVPSRSSSRAALKRLRDSEDICVIGESPAPKMAPASQDSNVEPPLKKKRQGNGKGKWAKNGGGRGGKTTGSRAPSRAAPENEAPAVQPTIPETLLAIPDEHTRHVIAQMDDEPDTDRLVFPWLRSTPTIQVRNSGSRGRGLYALANFRPGDVMYSEAPMATYIRNETDEQVLEKILQLSLYHMRAVWQLEGSGGYRSLIKGLREANQIPCVDEDDGSDNVRVGIFEFISRINHSCVPNAGWFWSESEQKLLLIAYQDIRAGTELTASYVEMSTLFQTRQDRKRNLPSVVGFKCECPLCRAGYHDEADRNRERLGELFVAGKWNEPDVNQLSLQPDVLERLHEAVQLLLRERLVSPLVDVYTIMFYVLAAWDRESAAKLAAGLAVAALTFTRSSREARKHFLYDLYKKPRSWLSYGFMVEN